jgi:glutamine amidotransferase-like uncharacterized protein
MLKSLGIPLTAAVILAALPACNSNENTASAGTSPGSSTSTQSPGTTPLPGGPTQSVQRNYTTDALVFAGNGTWGSEVTSIETILASHGATYQEVSSAQLDAMTLQQLEQFGVLVFPGGEGGTEAGSLSAATHANLRAAVQQGGVSYIGFCAGAFIGEAPAPAPGGDVSYGLGIVNGPVLDVYPLENQGVDYQMVELSYADGTTQDTLWYGGPVTFSGAGEVVAKYPDGTPAVSQTWSGAGFVILSGTHPTADAAILAALGLTSNDGTHTDTAWNLIQAALHQTPQAAF